MAVAQCVLGMDVDGSGSYNKDCKCPQSYLDGGPSEKQQQSVGINIGEKIQPHGPFAPGHQIVESAGLQ